MFLKRTRLVLLGCAIGLSMLLSAKAAPRVSANLALARQLNAAFVEVAEKVSPTVVIITVVQTNNLPGPDEVPEGLPQDFWHQFKRPEKSYGQGSGVIIRKDGYILTNGHVVEDADTIRVRIHDGRTFSATVRGIDPQSDLAVLKIEASDLPVAVLADSDKTRIGEFAIAIGAPLSLDYSVTFGHVSAKSRSNVIPAYGGGASMDQDFIQTDANINPGNSGGPLVNIEGEVIGINTLITGLRSGIGFAIPSKLAREISDEIVLHGKFTRAWLGVEIRSLREDPAFREQFKDLTDGVIVARVLPEGPADKSGLKANDVIVSVEGRKVATPQELRSQIRGRKVGQPVALAVYRDGKKLQMKVKPGEWVQPKISAAPPRRPALETDSAGLGLTVHPLSADIAQRLGLEETGGVLIVGVEKGKLAAANGLKPGDIITSVDYEPVSSMKDFQDSLKNADVKKGVTVTLLNGNTSRIAKLKQD